MNNNRQLALAAYLIGGILILIPLFDASTSLYPFSFGSSQWRFGAFGIMSNALMIPLSGLLVAMAAAVSVGHVRLLRVLGILSLVVALVIVVSMSLFSLDALQSRRLIKPEMKFSYYFATATALAKLLVSAVAFVLLWRGSRSERLVVQEPRAELGRGFGKRTSGAVVRG